MTTWQFFGLVAAVLWAGALASQPDDDIGAITAMFSLIFAVVAFASAVS